MADGREQDEQGAGGRAMPGLFRVETPTRGAAADGEERRAVRPQLTVQTSGLGGQHKTASSLSVRSHLRELWERRSRRGSASPVPGTASGTRSFDVSPVRQSMEPPRSARVISMIEDNEVDDFLNLQGEFIAAMEEEHDHTWLPKLSRVRTAEGGSRPVSTASENDELAYSSGYLSPAVAHGEPHFEEIELVEMAGHAGKDGDAAKTDHLQVPGLAKGEGRPRLSDGSRKSTGTAECEVTVEQEPLRLYGNSMGFISPDNRVRLRLARWLMHYRYSMLSQALLILYTVCLSYRQYNKQASGTMGNYANWSDSAFILCNCLFTAEMFAKIIAFGFWDDSQMFREHNQDYMTFWQYFGIGKYYRRLESKYGHEFMRKVVPFRAISQDAERARKKLSSISYTSSFEKREITMPRAFARNSWNRMDLISTVCYWIGLVLSFNNFDLKNGIRIFKTLATLRILRLTDTDTGLSSILKSIKYGLPQLINVGFMLLYFWVFFAILGVQSFQGSLRRQCVWIDPNDPSNTYNYDMQFCGGHYDAESGRPMPYIFADGTPGPAAKGFICPRYSRCISDANPYHGRISFDNIISSMELIFIIMSANTFTDLMYYTMDTDAMAASLFFIISTLFLTVWMMNLLVAVLYSSFEIANELLYQKQKESKSMQNLIVRKILQICNNIKQKAGQSSLPLIFKKVIKVYEKLEFIFVLLIFVDLLIHGAVRAYDDNNMILAYKFERILSFVLMIETLIRLFLYAPAFWKFLAKPTYVYDLIVAIISIIITQPLVHDKLGRTYYWLSIFQISRFYRVVLAFKITRNLWKRVLGNALMIWNLSGFYFLFLFLASLIISVYFEGTVALDRMAEEPFAMYSLPNTFLSLFIIGSTEDWTSILYLLQEESPNTIYAFFGAGFIMLWFVLANSVVLNIFIAVISQSLRVEEADKRKLQIRHYLKHVYPERIKQYTNATLISRIKKKLLGRKVEETTRDFRQFMFRGTAILAISQNYEELQRIPKETGNTAWIQQYLVNMSMYFMKKFRVIEYFQANPFFKKPVVVFAETNELSETNKKYSLQLNEWEEEKLQFLRTHSTFNNSFFILPPNNALRKFCQTIVPPSVGKRTDGKQFYEDTTDIYRGNKYFYHIKRDTFVAITFVATILMVMFSCYVTPLYRMRYETGSWSWLNVCECTFVALFTLEFLIKTIADGFLYSPNAYIMNPWNCIDLVVLISMWIDLLSWLQSSSNLPRLFRGLDALRALRFLTISHTARSTFKQVFFDGITKIAGACLIALSLLFPFTVWGLSLFRGMLGVCNDGDAGMSQCYNEFSSTVGNWEVLMPRVYHSPVLNMDNFPSAFRTLYEIVSLEGWVDLLVDLVSTQGVGMTRSPFASTENGIFLVLFNFLSMVFILTLFVSFIISNHAKTTGSAFLTVEEKSWLEVKKLLSRVKPEATPDPFEMSKARRFCHKLAVEMDYFWYAAFLQVMMFLHILTLMLRSYHESAALKGYASLMFILTGSIFLCQEILYIYGKGFKLVRTNGWDVFRFLVLLLYFLLNITYNYYRGDNGLSNIHAAFQLIVFTFVIPHNDILSELVNTAVASLPSILSLTYTWGILFLVYAIAMNQIFGLTRLGTNTTGNLNFRTVAKSLIVLFRCSFGESWNYIMHDITVSQPFCFIDPQTGYTDCGSKPYAYFLMMSWNVLSMYIFLNMFISLVIENFSYVYHRGDKKDVARRDELRKFKKAWNKFDQDGTGELEFSLLPKLMHSFDGAVSFKIWEGRLSIKNLVANYMQVNPADPYDVDVDLVGLNLELNTIDVAKIIQRRLNYRRFVREVHMTNAYYGCIKFSNILQQIPLYTEYNPRECLGIDEYVKWLYTISKVDKFLENERNVDALEMVVTRWKYVMSKRKSPSRPRTPIPPPPRMHVAIMRTPSESPAQRSIDNNVQLEDHFIWSPSEQHSNPFEDRESTPADNTQRDLIRPPKYPELDQ
ncbi:ACL143Cp [Eremothecium gossypii ATCC 10895]|uniref:Calcium-channel protein CCH1 n=1 Tax=Eremothecium gossypii (strain ATCC 10895 / CBS 109.51 / FGSC 9923 / NRRL Y-1056) TaxID=284811 RepID=Q75CR2_EREGS|nr:ACL143Cp [Eremothecium gossypii ATCC 10895]AAS51085.1 ACL143Cp [Eremothecium gossypii ATCC 10895]AEY95375.1 FACL143Cp [Eremothecium gossypii FDAG1]